MSKIILASSSPRRKELLQREGIDFIIDASFVDEILDPNLSIEEQLMKVAYDKSVPIVEKYPNDVVISADTTVYIDGQIIGKAKDAQHAREILLKLSSKTHTVYTAVCYWYQGKSHTFIDATKVTFKDISSLLDEYLDSNEWVGKAGAYAIQGSGDIFVDHVDGDVDNVIGLPVNHLFHELKKSGIKLL